MVKEIKGKLKKSNMDYASMTFLGESDVHVIASGKMKFLVTI